MRKRTSIIELQKRGKVSGHRVPRVVPDLKQPNFDDGVAPTAPPTIHSCPTHSEAALLTVDERRRERRDHCDAIAAASVDGISLYQRLLQHGLARIDQLGGLTRQRLIDMGVTSAEARASLLTAAQLLTNSRIETPVCIISEGEDASATWNRTPINYEPKSLYARGDILLPRSKHFPNIPRNDSLAAQRSNSLGPKLPNDLKMAMPPRILEMTGSNVGSLNKNYAPGEISFARPKTPVGILRKSSMRNQQSGEANRSCLPECGRKRTASTPKSVKIDESSLQHQNSTTNSANLESLIAERLRVEWIDLTKPPYTNAAGESGIPLRLVERYAEEVDKDFMTIAMILETLRERSLTGAGLHFTPNYDDIRTQRYLNCSGIKTDNLTDFLTTIGLPMYSNRLVAALGSAELALPACLTAVTDAQMVYGLDIPLTHVRRIRTEAALIPKSLLAANTSSMPRSNGLTKQMIFRRQQHHHHHQQQQSQQQQLQFRQVFSKSDILPPESGILDRV
ncbi:SAM and SH3 domain-containing protein [Echinococcus granulosus]|uniref:SAM and SH3 domain-containing protein n=1 Tax=Echinococcus granulosus TaxID=6210 RepID=W6UTN6_ECHGR|nr:SAM and SH3 domain-containing protein [Echinococcus granulosus]EUB61742.1 SAM and SH3 domain-containing protein [Echinococcus granulosus]